MLSTVRPPKLIKPYVLTLAREASRGALGRVYYVDCEPAPGAPVNECFDCVEAQVSKSGGRMLTGWAIWERPKLFVEAEFHAVWERADGRVIDVSPRTKPIRRILFAEDNGRRVTGLQVNNVRKPLTKDKDVLRFLALADQRFKLLNEGALRYQLGNIAATPQMLDNAREAAALEIKIHHRYGPWTVEE